MISCPERDNVKTKHIKFRGVGPTPTYMQHHYGLPFTYKRRIHASEKRFSTVIYARLAKHRVSKDLLLLT